MLVQYMPHGTCIQMTCHNIAISVPFGMLMELPNSDYCDTSTPPCRFMKLDSANCCKSECTMLCGLSDMVKAAV